MGLNKRLDEYDMYDQLRPLLMPCEEIVYAAYCVWRQTGFFAGRAMYPGYVAFTDQNRIIGYGWALIGNCTYEADLAYAQKIKIRNLLLFQKSVYIKVQAERKTELLFNVPVKVLGNKMFPNQEQNATEMLNQLKMMAGYLK